MVRRPKRARRGDSRVDHGRQRSRRNWSAARARHGRTGILLERVVQLHTSGEGPTVPPSRRDDGVSSVANHDTSTLGRRTEMLHDLVARLHATSSWLDNDERVSQHGLLHPLRPVVLRLALCVAQYNIRSGRTVGIVASRRRSGHGAKR